MTTYGVHWRQVINILQQPNRKWEQNHLDFWVCGRSMAQHAPHSRKQHKNLIVKKIKGIKIWPKWKYWEKTWYYLCFYKNWSSICIEYEGREFVAIISSLLLACQMHHGLCVLVHEILLSLLLKNKHNFNLFVLPINRIWLYNTNNSCKWNGVILCGVFILNAVVIYSKLISLQPCYGSYCSGIGKDFYNSILRKKSKFWFSP